MGDMFADHILLQSTAARHGLSPLLVGAIMNVESGGNEYAWNPEPKYRWFWDVRDNKPFRTLTPVEADSKIPPRDFRALAGDPDQEWWAQQASWGLMQVMGAVARELGYTRKYLTQLTDPEDSLEYGCRKLLQLKGRFHQGHGWEGVVAAYNAGTPRRTTTGQFVNQGYVDKVMKPLAGAVL
jgi:hypothetical protein